jgi:hypothetical protein
MPSLINTSEIDTEFPVPGQDNDSQGFRDNFTNIKSNLDTAKTEIETLQTDTVKVNADTVFLENNEGNPTQLVKANLRNFSISKFPIAAEDEIKTANALTLNFNDGDYQVYQFTQAAVNINFNEGGWPAAGRVGKITVELTSTAAGGTTITVDPNNNIDVKFDNSWNNNTTLIASNTNPVIIEFWTRTRGNTVFAKNLGEFN